MLCFPKSDDPSAVHGSGFSGVPRRGHWPVRLLFLDFIGAMPALVQTHHTHHPIHPHWAVDACQSPARSGLLPCNSHWSTTAVQRHWPALGCRAPSSAMKPPSTRASRPQKGKQALRAGVGQGRWRRSRFPFFFPSL